MPSEPTPTLTTTTGGEDMIVRVPPPQGEPVFSGPMFGGAAPSAPTTDAPTDDVTEIQTALHRALNIFDALSNVGEVDDCAFSQVTATLYTLVHHSDRMWDRLRGGATAPTPDHLMAIRRFLMNWVRPGNRVNAERELLNLLGLRRDTGASHE